MSTRRPILAIDDSTDDLTLTSRAFRKALIQNRLICLDNGQTAIDYLQAKPPYSDRLDWPLPCLILLDLKMPGMSGFEVLAWIKRDPVFRLIAVIVLSSSKHDKDISRAYDLGANSYLVKPTTFQELVERATAIKNLWLTVLRPSGLPPLVDQ